MSSENDLHFSVTLPVLFLEKFNKYTSYIPGLSSFARSSGFKSKDYYTTFLLE